MCHVASMCHIDFIYLLLFEIQLHRLVGGDTCENNPPIAYKSEPRSVKTHIATRDVEIHSAVCSLFLAIILLLQKLIERQKGSKIVEGYYMQLPSPGPL